MVYINRNLDSRLMSEENTNDRNSIKKERNIFPSEILLKTENISKVNSKKIITSKRKNQSKSNIVADSQIF